MPLPRIFTNDHASLITEWAHAAGLTSHHRQAPLVVIAHVKRDVPALLTDRGAPQAWADMVTRELRQSPRPVHWVPLKMLIEAQAVPIDQPGVYVWRHAAKDVPAFRVEPHGLVTIAHFRYEAVRGGRGLYVELTPDMDKGRRDIS